MSNLEIKIPNTVQNTEAGKNGNEWSTETQNKLKASIEDNAKKQTAKLQEDVKKNAIFTRKIERGDTLAAIVFGLAKEAGLKINWGTQIEGPDGETKKLTEWNDIQIGWEVRVKNGVVKIIDPSKENITPGNKTERNTATAEGLNRQGQNAENTATAELF